MATQTTSAVQPGGQFGSWLKGVRDYIDELKAEMRRVTWPSRKQVQATTAVVVRDAAGGPVEVRVREGRILVNVVPGAQPVRVSWE
jgi:cobyric acid synthase